MNPSRSRSRSVSKIFLMDNLRLGIGVAAVVWLKNQARRHGYQRAILGFQFMLESVSSFDQNTQNNPCPMFCLELLEIFPLPDPVIDPVKPKATKSRTCCAGSCAASSASCARWIPTLNSLTSHDPWRFCLPLSQEQRERHQIKIIS